MNEVVTPPKHSLSLEKKLRALAQKAAWMIQHAKRPGMPDNAICTHHGVSEYVGSMSVDMLTTGLRGRITLVFEVKEGISGAMWEKLREMVIEETGIQIWNHWNGEDKQESCSVVLMEFAPESIRRAIENYSEMPHTFKPEAAEKAGFDAFTKWWNSGR